MRNHSTKYGSGVPPESDGSTAHRRLDTPKKKARRNRGSRWAHAVNTGRHRNTTASRCSGTWRCGGGASGAADAVASQQMPKNSADTVLCSDDGANGTCSAWPAAAGTSESPRVGNANRSGRPSSSVGTHTLHKNDSVVA